MPAPISAAEALPYTDTKPAGAADFYCAVNATFRFLLRRFGLEGLKRYWAELGESYYRPVSLRWKEGGLAAVADYWKAFFQAEPGAQAAVELQENGVRLEVSACPAILHLRQHGREIVPAFCQHCYFVNEAIAAPAGMAVRVSGGNGRCIQHFIGREKAACLPPQRLEDIATAS